MSSSDGWIGNNSELSRDGVSGHGTLEAMLFESLLFQLIEKGLLTKNDALSIVQIVAQVKRSEATVDGGTGNVSDDLTSLRRLYESFHAMRERPTATEADRSNILELRPPLHGGAPTFPSEN